MHALRWPAAGGAPRGAAVVLVHGLCSARYFARAAPLLRGLGEVWVPDLPGFGRSPRAGGRPSVPALAAALGAWMDEAGLRDAVVVANSFGCQVAAGLLARRPELARRVVLTGPTFAPEVRRVARLLARFLVDAARQPAWQLGAHARDVLDAGPRHLLAALAEGLDHPLERDAAALPMPVLVARGSRDATAPARWVAALAAAAPRGAEWTCPGGAHAVHVTHPRALAGRVAAFAAG